MDKESIAHMKFAQRWLPMIIGLAALVVYLATLVRWGTFIGMASLIKVTGWDWRLIFDQPLLYLASLPIRWMPASWQIIANNGFAALCSALSLGLLARSVALLPHDRTKEQRRLERSDYSLLSLKSAWLPPLMAVLVCGFQISFWENSIVNTGESFDLLLFAFVVWSLLEFRLDEKNWRLILATWVFALGMANNYAMIAFSPVFLAALIWIKGLAFFNWRFILKVLGAALAGALLYLVLPAVAMNAQATHLGFWEFLWANMEWQKNSILAFPRYLVLIIGLTSLVPVIFMGIRWPAHFGDINPAGAKLTTYMSHLIHGVFAIASLYVAFDPPFSPRNLGGGLAFLPFYFLGALSAGYFTGYLLLVCGATTVKSWEKPALPIQILNRVVLILIWVALAAVPALLCIRNFPQISLRTGPELHAYGEAAAQSLPEGPAIVLSDDPMRIAAVESALSQIKPGHPYIFADTISIRSAAFHAEQRRRHGERWPNTFSDRPLWASIDDASILQFIVQCSQATPIYYLHPSFGYYFEKFYAKPHHMVCRLQPLPDTSLDVPLLTADEIREENRFWSGYTQEKLEKLAAKIRAEKDSKESNRQLIYVGQLHSIQLDFLGVEEQRAGHLDEALTYFQRAVELSASNPVAMINTNFNGYLKNPTGPLPPIHAEIRKALEPYQGNWNRILSANGPVDEPHSRFFLAQTFLQGNNTVQAVQQLLRAKQFIPQFYPIHLSLAGAYVDLKRGQDALAILAELKGSTNVAALPIDAQMSLLKAESWAHTINNDLPKAEALLRSAQTTWPAQSVPFTTLANILWSLGRQNEAMAVYEDQLKTQTNNVGVRVNLSAFKIYTGDTTQALLLLNQALQLAPKNMGALMNRAIANLNLRNLKEAKADYVALQALSKQPLPAVHYGLGEIAWLEKDYKSALNHYQEFLKLAPKNSTEYQQIESRVQAIRSGQTPPGT